MADIRHQPGRVKEDERDISNKTNYPHGQLALQFMKKVLLSGWKMFSVCDRKRRTEYPAMTKRDYENRSAVRRIIEARVVAVCSVEDSAAD